MNGQRNNTLYCTTRLAHALFSRIIPVRYSTCTMRGLCIYQSMLYYILPFCHDTSIYYDLPNKIQHTPIMLSEIKCALPFFECLLPHHIPCVTCTNNCVTMIKIDNKEEKRCQL